MRCAGLPSPAIGVETRAGRRSAACSLDRSQESARSAGRLRRNSAGTPPAGGHLDMRASAERAPCAPAQQTGSLLDVLDEESHAHVGAPLAEVVATQTGRHDVDGLDVAQRLLGLSQRLLDGVVRAVRRAADEFDDLHDGHDAPSCRGHDQPTAIIAHRKVQQRKGQSDSPHLSAPRRRSSEAQVSRVDLAVFRGRFSGMMLRRIAWLPDETRASHLCGRMSISRCLRGA